MKNRLYSYLGIEQAIKSYKYDNATEKVLITTSTRSYSFNYDQIALVLHEWIPVKDANGNHYNPLKHAVYEGEEKEQSSELMIIEPEDEQPTITANIDVQDGKSSLEKQIKQKAIDIMNQVEAECQAANDLLLNNMKKINKTGATAYDIAKLGNLSKAAGAMALLQTNRLASLKFVEDLIEKEKEKEKESHK